MGPIPNPTTNIATVALVICEWHVSVVVVAAKGGGKTHLLGRVELEPNRLQSSSDDRRTESRAKAKQRSNDRRNPASPHQLPYPPPSHPNRTHHFFVRLKFLGFSGSSSSHVTSLASSCPAGALPPFSIS